MKSFTYTSVFENDVMKCQWQSVIFAKDIKHAERKAKRQCKKFKEKFIAITEDAGVK